jgi:hypothetical protein
MDPKELFSLWQSILACDCNISGTWCDDCCEAFSEIGNFLESLTVNVRSTDKSAKGKAIWP